MVERSPRPRVCERPLHYGLCQGRGEVCVSLDLLQLPLDRFPWPAQFWTIALLHCPANALLFSASSGLDRSKSDLLKRPWLAA